MVADLRKQKLLESINKYGNTLIDQGASDENVSQLARTGPNDQPPSDMATSIYDEAAKVPLKDQNELMNNRIQTQDPTKSYDYIQNEGPTRAPAGVLDPEYQDSQGKQRNVSNMTGDLMVGASHALLGLLSGNHNRAAMEYGKGNNYLAENQAKDIAANKAGQLVMTVDESGNPVYTPSQQAAGEKPFIKPLRPNAAGMPKQTNFYNPSTKQVEKGSFSPLTGQYSNAAGEIIKGAQEYIPTQFKEVKTAGGTSQFIPLNAVTGGQAGPTVNGPAGEAALKGQGSEQYKTALDLSKQFPKEIAPIQQKLAQANAALNSMSSLEPHTQAQGAILAQQYLQDAKTNGSMINVVSPGQFDKLIEIAQRAATGKASAGEIDGLSAAVQQVAAAQQGAINSMGKATTMAAGPESSSMLKSSVYSPQSITPKMPVIPAAEHPERKDAARWANSNLRNPDPKIREQAKRILYSLKGE